uniref:PDZ domain-containing protein n=1 Tax=Glossina brevipalpis TaxID=37001 RepID=A0A1A9W3J2_9MUSC
MSFERCRICTDYNGFEYTHINDNINQAALVDKTVLLGGNGQNKVYIRHVSKYAIYAVCKHDSHRITDTKHKTSAKIRCVNMVLSTEWSQVEVVDLVNDGNGLGFILVGGRSTGVVIKALTPGGVAERDARLQCGDHLLQIGEVNLRGFSSEQVATVLRQTGAQVRLIVARPVEPAATDLQTLASQAPIIPTKLLSDPEELTRYIYQKPVLATSASANGGGQEGYTTNDVVQSNSVVSSYSGLSNIPDTELADLPLPPIPKELSDSMARIYSKDLDILPFSILSPPTSETPTFQWKTADTTFLSSRLVLPMDHDKTVIASSNIAGTKHIESDCWSIASSGYIDSPETETYEVKLRKNVYGLGITVAGYVCEEEDVSGIFVKSIIEGSAAEMSGQIQINDRIVAVDGKTLAGVTNHQAVEILRNTDIEVNLTLERFLRGRKFEHLQIALTELKACADTQSQISLPLSPSIATLSWLPPKSDADSIATDTGANIIECCDISSRDTVDSNMSHMLDRSNHSLTASEAVFIKPTTTYISSEGSVTVNGVFGDNGVDSQDLQKTTCPPHDTLESKTSLLENISTTILLPVPVPSAEITDGPKSKIQCSSPSVESLTVAWKSLGISLEGTVDVECGIEKRPHHYIRSILEDGPVGRQGILKPGDELLQVNEYKLQGLKHIEVVKILKELPSHVKLVCVRGPTAPSIINTSQNAEAFETRSLLPGGHQSLQNLLTKAQSESSLYTSSTATLTDQHRFKSLENVSGLALWSTDITFVEIEKTEQGFGFSILDYQDPLDPEGSVIVIRGLIHGGSAEATNEIFPGDRLVSAGDHTLHGLDLNEAVTKLKSMPLGVTKLGICRPLSTSDSNVASPEREIDSPTMNDGLIVSSYKKLKIDPLK